MGISQGISNSGGPYGGMLPPRLMAGMAIYPYGYMASAGTITITAGQLYAVPCPIFRTTTFAGARLRDSGSGNNGQNVRIGLYAESPSGGLGSLLKDFGGAALTGTAGTHNCASSVTVTGPQICYLVLVGDSGSVLQAMSPLEQVTAAGYAIPQGISTTLGDLTSTMSSSLAIPLAFYCTQSYGAVPTSGPTLTNTIMGTGVTGTSAKIPQMQLYC